MGEVIRFPVQTARRRRRRPAQAPAEPPVLTKMRELQEIARKVDAAYGELFALLRLRYGRGA